MTFEISAGITPGCDGQEPVPGGLCSISVSDPKSRDDAAVRIVTAAIGELVGQEREFALASIGVEGADTRRLNLEERIDGRRTGLYWEATVVGDMVTSLSGSVAVLKPIKEVATVSPRGGVGRLNDPRFRPDRSAGSMVVAGPGTVAGEPVVPPLPDLSGPIHWPSLETIIVGAEPGWTSHTAGDGPVLLLPSLYLLDEQGNDNVVVAVAESDLNFGY